MTDEYHSAIGKLQGITSEIVTCHIAQRELDDQAIKDMIEIMEGAVRTQQAMSQKAAALQEAIDRTRSIVESIRPALQRAHLLGEGDSSREAIPEVLVSKENARV